MLEGMVICAIVNILLLAFTSGADIISFNSQAIINVFSPYDYNIEKMKMLSLISNMTLTYVIVLLLQKRCDENLKMICYQLKNRKRSSIYFNQKKDIYKYLLALIIGKVLSDIIFNYMFGTVSIVQMIYVEISFIFTITMWSELVYLLRMFISSKYCFFVTLLIIIISILLLPYLKDGSFLAYTLIDYKIDNIMLKFMSGIVFSSLSILSIRNKDILF